MPKSKEKKETDRQFLLKVVKKQGDMERDFLVAMSTVHQRFLKLEQAANEKAKADVVPVPKIGQKDIRMTVHFLHVPVDQQGTVGKQFLADVCKLIEGYRVQHVEMWYDQPMPPDNIPPPPGYPHGVLGV